MQVYKSAFSVLDEMQNGTFIWHSHIQRDDTVTCVAMWSAQTRRDTEAAEIASILSQHILM